MRRNVNRCLIVGEYLDYDSACIAWGVEKLGIPCDVVNSSSLTTTCSASIHYSDNSSLGDAIYKVDDRTFHVNKYDSVLLRRFSVPHFKTICEPSDYNFIRQEWTLFIGGFVQSLRNSRSFIINPVESYGRKNLKAAYLSVAKEVGLSIPKTLISNDVIEIRKFIRNNDRVIAKVLGAGSWSGKDKVFLSYTSIVELSNIEDKESVSLAPMIFQEFIYKKNEVRVVVFGKTILAYSILSDNIYKNNIIDIRKYDNGSSYHEINIPEEIKEKILILMKKCKLLYGALDFVISEKNEWVFLEINEVGQCLYIESHLPSAPLLDVYVKFLLSRNPMFVYDRNSIRDITCKDATQDNRYKEIIKKLEDSLESERSGSSLEPCQ